jgi:hypothetical protein
VGSLRAYRKHATEFPDLMTLKAGSHALVRVLNEDYLRVVLDAATFGHQYLGLQAKEGDRRADKISECYMDAM